MEEKIKVIDIDNEMYPESLRSLENSAPKKLYCIGDINLLKKRCVAVVGARKASQYGKWISYNAGKKLAAYDVVTVSGMAYGCDSNAHCGALDAMGKTIAVLGCGLDICYPKKNKLLRNRIIENGLIISEYPPGTEPAAYNFPRRNRIISGLSEIVVVAEATIASGSLITAGLAAEQGKCVMAVPGNISNIMSLGCNKLIQDGVEPVVSLDDIITRLGILLKQDASQIAAELGADEKRIYEFVRNNGEVTADYIAGELKKSITEVNAIVSILEIKGVLLSSMGKIYIAK